MSMPKWVKVGPRWFRLKVSRRAVADTAQAVGYSIDGVTDLSAGSIFINPDIGGDYKRVVVCHESLHAMLEDILHDMNPTVEEAIVKQLAYVLLGWIRDNPDLMTWLQHVPG